MVGLSVVLEAQKKKNNNTDTTQVINKATNMSSMAVYTTSEKARTFLERCFLCNAKLVSGKDIYMYKGDEAFCSMECRSNQICRDEAEETTRKEKGSADSAGHRRSDGGMAY